VATAAGGGAAAVDSTIFAMRDAVVINASRSISATDTSLDNQNVIVAAGTTTINGSHHFKRVAVMANATLTHDVGSRIDATGGGGALAIEYTDAASQLPTLTAIAGQGNPWPGGAGTIFVRGPQSTYGDVTIGGGVSGQKTVLPSLGRGTALAGSSGASLV